MHQLRSRGIQLHRLDGAGTSLADALADAETVSRTRFCDGRRIPCLRRKGPSMVNSFKSFRNFSFVCLVSAAALAAGASALAYSVPRAPLGVVAIGEPGLGLTLEQ